MRMVRLYLLVCLVVISLLVPAAVMAKKVKVRGFAPGSQDPAALNAGLKQSEYGYHPDDDGSWGESWCIQARNEQGDFIYVLLSISNYYPLHKFGGTVSMYFYTHTGERYGVHQEFKSDRSHADLEKVSVNIGGNRFYGEHPTYHFEAEMQDLGFDLTFTVETPDLMLGQDKILFGEKGDRYWNLTVLAPRAQAAGTVTAGGNEYQFEGRGYLEHGWSTYKIYKFSRWWYVVRVLQDDFSMTSIRMVMRDNFEPDGTQAIYITLGDEIIANSGDVTLSPQGTFIHEESGITLPASYNLQYHNGGTRLTGVIRMNELGAGKNVLGELSPIIQGLVKTFVTDPWQFRYVGQGEFTLVHDGEARKITAPVIGEVHYYR